MESELDLAERLGFSPSTMPAAMRLLVDKKGLLMGRRGIGTLVAPTLVRRAVALSSLHDDSKEAGREPTSAPGRGPSAPASPRRERKFKNDPDHEWLC